VGSFTKIVVLFTLGREGWSRVDEASVVYYQESVFKSHVLHVRNIAG